MDVEKKAEVTRKDAYRLYSICEALDNFVTMAEHDSPEKAELVKPLSDAIITILDVADELVNM